MLEISVGKSGCEDFYTIQEALDAVPYETPAVITVKEGIYHEKLFSDKSCLTVRGEGSVLVTYDDSARELLADGEKRGTFRSYTAFFSGHCLSLENLTISNTAGAGCLVGQAVALYLDVDNSKVTNVTLIGDQDTLFLAPLPDTERERKGFYGPRCFAPRKENTAIFEHCHIEGGVDFIFGGADALFRECEIVSTSEGFVTAPSGRKDRRGFVFYHCRFTTTLKNPGKVFLMRPWRPEGKTAVISSEIGDHIDSALWCAWPGRDAEKHLATFSLYDENGTKGSFVTYLSKDEAESLVSSF